MKAEYKRDMSHNYLILQGTDLDTSSYQIRMLVGNAIPWLLKCRIQAMDESFLFYYDITSRQEAEALFEGKKLSYEDLQMLFGGFIQVMEQMSEYLLNPCDLVLQPRFMYVDAEKKELSFCYLPGYGKDVRVQFQALTEYVLPKLDHEDGKAVMLGYGIYRRALEDGFHLEHMKEELYQVRDGKKQTDGIQEKESKQESEEKEEIEISFPEEKARAEACAKVSGRSKWILAAVYGGIAVALVLLAAAHYLGYLPRISMEWLLVLAVAAVAAGMVISVVLRKMGKEIEPAERYLPVEENVSKEPEVEMQESLSKEPSKEWENPIGGGETMVLSVCNTAGPATLVSREPGELATIYLQEEITVIGKLETAADVVIPLPTVSRIHAKIRRRDGEYFLTDLNSRNGTSVNGIMLKSGEDYCLQEEDQVDFAQARYVFLK